MAEESARLTRPRVLLLSWLVSPAPLCSSFPSRVFASLWYHPAFLLFLVSKLSLPLVLSHLDGELYSGTVYNFLGSEPIISRYSPSQSLLRTEYSTSWLNGGFSVCVFVFTVFGSATVPLGTFSCFSCRAQFCFC